MAKQEHSKISEAILARKGAVRATSIPKEVIALLELGSIESVNLVEWQTIDQEKLLANIWPKISKDQSQSPSLLEKTGIKGIREVATILKSKFGDGCHNNTITSVLSSHPSDMVRCWVVYWIGVSTFASLEQKLKEIKRFAVDEHFGVREIAWLAVRPDISDQLEHSLSLLASWTLDECEYARRFASEVTRPRGVWCKHIEPLKKNPELAIENLESLRSDPSRYVQASVGNWLNDASKSAPEWVENLCEKWLRESKTPETSWIVQRALRTLHGKPSS